MSDKCSSPIQVCARAGSLLLFGGGNDLTIYPDGYIDETRTFDGQHWTLLSVSPRPPPRQGAGLATQGRRVVLFGGVDPQNARQLNDTWTFDGSSLTQLTLSDAGYWRDDDGRCGR